MTARVTDVLNSIKSMDLFYNTDIYFIGGTALSYYLEHRIFEDIDIISMKPLPYKSIISAITNMGGQKLRDENAVTLRMALLSRYKSRDLFDFKVILEKNILSKQEILNISSQTKKEWTTVESLQPFIKKLEQTKDDEVVYLDEKKPINLMFEEIKEETLEALKNIS